jgi:hypothetical protein
MRWGTYKQVARGQSVNPFAPSLLFCNAYELDMAA